MVLWLPLQYLGDTYKWMLYGDDDTLFFVDGIVSLLQDFDPEMPYFISGALGRVAYRRHVQWPLRRSLLVVSAAKHAHPPPQRRTSLLAVPL